MKKTARTAFVFMSLLMVFVTGCSTIHSAASTGNLADVQQHLQEGADVNAKDKNGNTPLILAADKGHLDVVKFLVGKGADLNAKAKADKFRRGINPGDTPLILAADNGHLDMVKFLVDKGADVNARNNDGDTALMRAAHDRNLKVVFVLVDVNAGTMLFEKLDSHLEVVKVLVDKGADVDARNNDGETPLMQAALRSHLEVVKFLVDKGADLNARDKDGRTPLKHAADNRFLKGHLDVITFLVDTGADMNARGKEGWTPLDMQKIAVAEELLISGSQILDMNGNWTDDTSGRVVYDKLQDMERAIVTKAIMRKIIREENRLRVLFLAVKLGIPGSEERLNDVLLAYGDESMAEDYINSGSSSLYEGGKEWAKSHGYYISTGVGSHRVGWGRF